MMAKNLQSTRAALVRLSSIWPADPLRPEMSFAGFLAARAEALGDTANPPAQDAFGRTPLHIQIRALEDLTVGKIAEAYPLSNTLLRPKAMPEYYEKLVKELKAAPERSWWQGMLNSWKGYIRMK